MSWLIRKIPRPSSRSCLIRSPTCLVSAGPSAAVGSSMIRIRALKCTARAIATDWRCPPDERGDRHHEVLELRVQPAHQLPGGVLHRAVVEVAEPRRELASEEHVARRVDVVRERERLIDRLDAQRLGVPRVRDRHRLAARSGSGPSPQGARPTAFGSAWSCPRRCRRPVRPPRRDTGRPSRRRPRGRLRTRRGCRAARPAAYPDRSITWPPSDGRSCPGSRPGPGRSPRRCPAAAPRCPSGPCRRRATA